MWYGLCFGVVSVVMPSCGQDMSIYVWWHGTYWGGTMGPWPFLLLLSMGTEFVSGR